ncbi:N6-adenosine-methyltransferase TMT1A-like [Phycodurus eques]|uniref:N6-adenosine-methyltransferase TMT1A-like n=1 Tax=Phycodurus eques TaxID=693459 RepID=UPI002ACEE587|nr:N6-adenosine-methyltransferase TMT1A-like [Phycodurus eques]
MSFLMKCSALVVRVLLCLPLHLLDAVGLHQVDKRVVPRCLYRLSKLYNKKMYEKKKELFACLVRVQAAPRAAHHFEKYPQRNMRENPHVTYEKFVEASAEDMVVCTLVLCSVDNVPQTLREVRRVLRSGGAFFFLEHVAAEPSTWTYFFQHVSKPVRYFIGDGCEVTRATWTHLQAAGFSDLKLRHMKAPLIFFNKPHIMGNGVK